jgi:hypothetical protein
MLARVPYGLVTAGPDGRPDPFLADLIARHAADAQSAAARRAAIAAGLIPPPPPAVRWNASDRH